jgi:hypothetical protein
VRRPLNVVLMRFFGRWNPALARRAAQAGPHAGTPALLTGALLLVHSAALITLALSVSTGTFVALSQPVGWAILGLGVAGLLWYRRKHADLRKSHDFAE